MSFYSKLQQAVLNGEDVQARTLTEQALAAGEEPLRLVNEAMIPAMDEVGRRFETNEYFVPELLLSARAMKAGLGLIRPILARSGVQPVARIVIGTVKGDQHDIGKNLVAAMFEGGGFEVHDLGVNVSPERFIEAVRSKNAHFLAMSALLTTTMPSMRNTIEAVRKAGLRGQVKILIGGAPVTQKYASEIGADGYSPNAPSAVTLARSLISCSG